MARAGLAGAMCLGAAGFALAQGPSYQAAELVLETPEPASPSSAHLHIDYVNPDDPAAKPHAVAQVVETFPPGTLIDTSAPEVCSASDAEFATLGQEACPPGSRVGGGELDLDTGTGVLAFKVTLFNNRDELILFVEQEGGGIRTPSRARVDGDRPEGAQIVAQVPPIPGGPPDGFTAIKRVRVTIDAVTRAGKSYLTTPASCPTGGSWTSRLEFTYRNGTKQTTTNGSPCTVGAGAPADRSPPRIALRGVPKPCAAQAFRLRVRVRDRSRLRRAGVRLDGRVMRNTRRKRFRVRVPARPGSHRLTVVARDDQGNRSRRSVRFRGC